MKIKFKNDNEGSNDDEDDDDNEIKQSYKCLMFQRCNKIQFKIKN